MGLDDILALVEQTRNIQLLEGVIAEEAAILGGIHGLAVDGNIEDLGSLAGQIQGLGNVLGVHLEGATDIHGTLQLQGAGAYVEDVAVLLLQLAVEPVVAGIQGQGVVGGRGDLPSTGQVDGGNRRLLNGCRCGSAVVDDDQAAPLGEHVSAVEGEQIACSGIHDLATAGELGCLLLVGGVDEVAHGEALCGELAEDVGDVGIVDDGIGLDLVCGDDQAAVGLILFKQLVGVGQEGDVRRNHDLVVAHLADDQLGALHAAVTLHEDLVAQVVEDMLGVQLMHDLDQLLVVVVQVLVGLIVVADPCGGLGVHDQGVDLDLTLGKKHTDAAHGVVEHLVVGPPGLLAVHGRGIVALTDAAERIALQVLAHEVDTAHHHPFVVTLQLVVTHVVTAESEGLGQHLLLAGLCGGGAKLCHGEAGEDGTAEPVHAGNGEIFIVRHTSAVGGQLGVEGLLQHHVTRETEIMSYAPVVDLLHEVPREQLGHQLPEAHTGNLIVPASYEQLDEVIVDGLAISLLVLCGEDEAPRNTVTGDLGLVGEEAVEIRAVFGVVRLVDLIDKVGDHFPIQGVHIEGVDVVVEAVVLKATDDVVALGILQVGGEGADTEVLLLILETLAVDHAAAKSRRPAVFVIGPGVHTALFGILHAGGDVLEPLLAHVLGLQASAGVHEEATDAHVVHEPHLAQGLGDVQLLVPRPEGYGTVLFVDVFEVHMYFLLSVLETTK